LDTFSDNSLEGQNINLSKGLVAWYKFDGNAKDSSGNGNDAIVYGISYIMADGYSSAKFDRTNETRLQLPFSFMPKSGSIVMNVKIFSGYDYSKYELNENYNTPRNKTNKKMIEYIK